MVVEIEGDDIKIARILEWENGRVHHGLLWLDEPLQGKGFATRLNEAMFRQYKVSGFTYVTVHAGLDKGGYVWAARRFDWDGNARVQATTALERLWKVAARRGTTAEERRLLGEMEARLARGDIPKPRELSQLGRTPGAHTWLGKEGMLGSSWKGRKDL